MSGKQSRAVALAAATLVSTAGCSTSPPSSLEPAAEPSSTQSGVQETDVAPGEASTHSPVAPPPATSTVDAATPACLVDMPSTWQEALLPGPVPGPKQPATHLSLGAEDGSFASFVATAAPRLEWTDHQGEVEVVQEFTERPEAQVLSSDYDGRYLAYSVTWSYEVFLSPWSIYVWDTTTGGEPLLIGSSPEGDYPDGTPGVAPLPGRHWKSATTQRI